MNSWTFFRYATTVLTLYLGLDSTIPARGQTPSHSKSASTHPEDVGKQPKVLELLTRETPKPNYGKPVPETISGKVVLKSDQVTSAARGISVTDGFSVVKTDALGNYELKTDPRAVFIFLTRPSGFNVHGDWYKPIASEVNFSLEPAEDESNYIFVHVTDTHVSQNRRSLAGLSRFVQELNELSPKPRFVVNSGDLLNLHKALLNSPAEGHADFRRYVGIMNHLTMPSYNVAGDHTDSSYRLEDFPRGHLFCGKPLYWEYLGPHLFSFEYGRIHFVSVDFGYHLGRRQISVNGKTLDYPTLEVQPDHVKWLKQDMAARSSNSFVVTAAEHDLSKHCPEFLEIAQQNDVRLQLAGDTHVLSHKTRPVPYRTAGALAGCWWNPKAQQLCPDLSPQGYLVYNVRGEKMDHFYKGLGRRVEIVSHRLGAVLQGNLKLQAHLVQPQPGETLEFSINGKDWKEMREIGRPFYRALFSVSIDSTLLPNGLTNISVRNSKNGETRTRKFVVANKSQSKKFSEEATLSFDVSPPTSWTTAKAPSQLVDVLLNGEVIGKLKANARHNYAFTIPSRILRNTNVLSFHLAAPDDGFSLSSPKLTYQGNVYIDLRDEALRKVAVAHWGDQATSWGGFIVGNAEPPDETPFHRKQNKFCFLLP